MKTCANCRTSKPDESFGKYDRNRDGLKSYCKPCENERIAQNRKKPEIHARRIAYDQQRNARPEVQAAAAARRSTPEAKAAICASVAAYNERKPQVKAAHMAVWNAVRNGALRRLPCQVCGETAEAHHPDYSAPLAVVWLCRPHHLSAHAVTRGIAP